MTMDLDIPYTSLAVVLLGLCSIVHGLGEVIYAVNCGGEAHTDLQGI